MLAGRSWPAGRSFPTPDLKFKIARIKGTKIKQYKQNVDLKQIKCNFSYYVLFLNQIIFVNFEIKLFKLFVDH